MKVGDIVKAKPNRHPAGVIGVIVDIWYHPNGCGTGFHVHFPGTAHRSDSYTDTHAKYANELEVINEGR